MLFRSHPRLPLCRGLGNLKLENGNWKLDTRGRKLEISPSSFWFLISSFGFSEGNEKPESGNSKTRAPVSSFQFPVYNFKFSDFRCLTEGGDSRSVSACISRMFVWRPNVDSPFARPRRMSSVSPSGDSTESDFKVSPLCQRKNSFWESTTELNRAAWW